MRRFFVCLAALGLLGGMLGCDCIHGRCDCDCDGYGCVGCGECGCGTCGDGAGPVGGPYGALVPPPVMASHGPISGPVSSTVVSAPK